MEPARIPIPERPASIAVERTGGGGLRITHSRRARLIVAAGIFLGGCSAWVAQLPADPWGESLQYVLAVLLVAPGAAVAWWAMARRPVVEAGGGELVVRYGRPFFERPLARLPLDTLEVRVTTTQAEGVRYDGRVLTGRLLAAFSLGRGKLPISRLDLHVVQVRSGASDAWLSVIGSQLGSEVESARLALAAAADASVPVELAEDTGSEQ
ncbi:MAG: hypothetical protein R6V58_06170 [Planctomycetota bacterium]